jgi:hypothetical protein
VDGRHVDDGGALATRLEHRRDLVPHPVQDAVEVDVDDAAPVVQVELAGRRLGAADAGVVDRVVQGSVGVDGVADDRLGVFGRRGVLPDRAGAATGVGDLRGHPLGGVEVDVGEHDPGPPGRQVLADRLADPRATAGDDGDLSVERGHHDLLLCRRSGWPWAARLFESARRRTAPACS